MLYSRIVPCIVGAFTNILKHNTVRSKVTVCRPYKYLLRTGIEPATRGAVDRPAAAPTTGDENHVSNVIGLYQIECC